jgi:ABC-type bacteriocin/lantibiotic exporter with double-glycine peptidase domain
MSEFWWGILTGGIVSFIASMLANYTPRFGRSFIERNKIRARKKFKEISRLKRDPTERIIYFSTGFSLVVLLAVMFFSMVILDTLDIRTGFTLLGFFYPGVAILCFMMMAYVMVTMIMAADRIENFKKYEKSYRAKVRKS